MSQPAPSAPDVSDQVQGFSLADWSDTGVQAAIIAGVFTAIGWLVAHVLALRSDREKQRLLWRMEYTRKQLEELYGPLAFLKIEERQVFDDYRKMVGRDYVSDPNTEEIPREDVESWLYWSETYFLPRNEQIRDIMLSKIHLIDSPSLPESFIQFMRHEASWRILHKRWKERNIEYSWHSSIWWPERLEDDVLEIFGRLNERQARIIGELGRHRKIKV